MPDSTDPTNVLRQTEAATRAALISDVRYDVDLDLGDGRGDAFVSTTRITFASSTPGASTFVDLTATDVLRAAVNGVPVAADAFDGHRLRLDGLATTNEVLVIARCAYQRTGTGLHRFVDPADDAVYLHTQFEPFDAHLVYACFDQPDIKARFALTVRAPAAWTVVSNEPVVAREPDDDDVDIWRFETTPPISTYITALVAGPLHVVHADDGPVPMALYCRTSLARYLEPAEMFEITRAGMAFYERVFGHTYPFAKYDQLFVPEFNFGAMENAGCVTFSESYLFRSKVTDAARMARGATVLHELAHMWFGDLVTMRWWGDLWLNESFATYMSYWALTKATRFTDAWVQFVNREVSWAIRQDQLPTTHPIVADAPDTDTAINNFDGITYAKGALVLTQLVAWVGPDAFTAGLQDYFARHAWGNATLADFLGALEKTSGRRMDRWAQQWLETTGVNTLEVVTTVTDGTYASAEVLQRPAEGPGGPSPLRDQRIAIGLYDVHGDGVARRPAADLDVTGALTSVPALAGQPEAPLVVPNDRLRSYSKVRLDDRSLATLRRHLSDIDEPLSRSHGWLIAWDLLRDAHLPARDFVQLVADHVHRETQSDTLRTLVRQAIAAADRYGDPEHRAQAMQTLAAAAREALAAAAAGSDQQLVWARCRMVTDDPQWTLAVLDGSAVPDGLQVDHDLRWHAVHSLAARGVAGADAIERTHDQDPTDEGMRRATAARAARPLPEAKAEAWTLATDGDRPLALRRAACAGFQRYDQVELLRPYVERYADELASFWQGQVRQESIDLTSGLFPDAVVDEATVTRTRTARDTASVPHAGRRVLDEHIDELQRTLRTRAADRV